MNEGFVQFSFSLAALLVLRRTATKRTCMNKKKLNIKAKI